MYKAILFDWETLGNKPTSVVLDLAAVVFNLDGDDVFEDLIVDPDRTFRAKFDVTEQLSIWKRTTDKSTIAWWKQQGEDAQKVLKPDSRLDVSLEEGMTKFKDFANRHKITNSKETLGYVRGQSFDFPILANVVQSIWPDFDYTMFPVAFWNQRDTRTALAHDLCTPMNTKCPLPEGIFKEFVAHNSIHDCARDVISLQRAWKYKLGEIEIPEKFQLY
jgi:hypothetical protein